MLQTPKSSRAMEWLTHTRNVFVAGLLVSVPLVLTYLVFSWLVEALDGIFQPLIVLFLGHTLPGVGLVAILVLIFILGLITTSVGGLVIIRAVDSLMFRVPVIHWVYRPTKQAVDAMRSLRKSPFKRVVIVEFPRPDMYALAFVTGKPVNFKGEERMPVFIPHAPNPMTGFMLLLAPKDLVDTDLSVEEAMRMVVSGGLLSPDTIGQPAPSQAPSV